MLQLIKAEKRLAFSKIFLDDEDHLPNDLILRIIDYFNLIRVRIYNIRNELINDMYLPGNKTIKDLKHKVSEFMNHPEYRMLYKIDRDGKYETRDNTYYPDEYLLSNTHENLELFVISHLGHVAGGGKRRRRKSTRKKRRSTRKKRKSKRKTKTRRR
jgi:hypothetical protein